MDHSSEADSQKKKQTGGSHASACDCRGPSCPFSTKGEHYCTPLGKNLHSFWASLVENIARKVKNIRCKKCNSRCKLCCSNGLSNSSGDSWHTCHKVLRILVHRSQSHSTVRQPETSNRINTRLAGLQVPLTVALLPPKIEGLLTWLPWPLRCSSRLPPL